MRVGKPKISKKGYRRHLNGILIYSEWERGPVAEEDKERRLDGQRERKRERSRADTAREGGEKERRERDRERGGLTERDNGSADLISKLFCCGHTTEQKTQQ